MTHGAQLAAPSHDGVARTVSARPAAKESAPIRGVPEAILGLQRDAGNRATAELIGRLSRASAAVLQRCAAHPCSAGGCKPAAEEPVPGQVLARTAVHGGQRVGAAPPIVDSVLRSGGQPLDATSRSAMQSRFGRDFGDVRLHTGAQAALSTRAVSASAYTVGSHIVVGDEFVAGSLAGQRMLAHELVHVIQQEGAVAGVQGATPVLDAGDPLEQEAHAIADRVAAGGRADVAGHASGQAVHRQPREPALVPQAAGGCGICFSGDVRAIGITAHRQIQSEFEAMYPLIHTEFVVEPPGSRYIINKGVPDLLIGTPTGVQVGEIKPANVEGYIEGGAKIEIYRILLEEKYGKTNPSFTVEPMDLAPPAPSVFAEPGSLTCVQQLYVNPSVRGVYGYFCLPPFSNELRRRCKCRKRDRKEEERRFQQWQAEAKPQEQKQRRKVRAKLVGADPAFAEYANRVRLPLVQPGQQFIVAFRDDLYTKAVDEFNRRLTQQRMRVMQVDPRGVPFLAVQAPLIPIAIVFGAIEFVIVGGMVAAAIVAAAPAAAAAATTATVAEAGAGTAVAAEVGTAAAPTLTVIQGGAATTAATGGTVAASGGAAAAGGGVAITLNKAAAAVIIAKIVVGGGSRAEAAEAIQPLVDTHISAVLEVSERGGVDAYKPGQPISINDGNRYRAAIAFTADESR